jgi:hypothetical protein
MKPCFGTPRSDNNFLDISLPRRCMRVVKSEDWVATGLSKRIRIKKYTGLSIQMIIVKDLCRPRTICTGPRYFRQ